MTRTHVSRESSVEPSRNPSQAVRSHKLVSDLAREHHLLAALEPLLFTKVINGCAVRQFGANRPILRSGDPPDHVLFLLKGSVRVYYRHDDGSELLIKLFRAPAVMCEMEILAGIPVMPNARTTSASAILYVPAALFRRLADTNLAFARLLAGDLATRLCVASDRQRALAFSDLEYRLSNLLLDYANLSGVRRVEGLLIEMRITQQSMANDLAVSRKAVNRVLQKLRHDGVLSKWRARYLIHDVDALRHRCALGLLATHELGVDVPALRIKPMALASSST